MSNLSVGSSSIPTNIDRPVIVFEAPKVKAPVLVKDGPGTSNARVVSMITTTHDLKNAERKGENITISDEQLIKAIDHAIKLMAGYTTSLEFSVHERTKQIMVKVLDKDTGKIIREIPPEKTLDFVAKMWEMAGILIDERG